MSDKEIAEEIWVCPECNQISIYHIGSHSDSCSRVDKISGRYDVNPKYIHADIMKKTNADSYVEGYDKAEKDLKDKWTNEYIDIMDAGKLAEKIRDIATKNIRAVLNEIYGVATGEEQVAMDDTEGMEWIAKRIEKFKADLNES